MLEVLPLISVIMPVYNGEKYLVDAIESILHQTFQNFEFIIIDDGSSDGSLKLIQRYASLDERIVVISRENKGLIATLNEGIEVARGKYIARMDADDISLPKRFEKQIATIEKEQADIVGCHWQIINESGKFIDCSTVPLKDESIILSLGYSVPFAHGSVMMKKEFLEKHRLQYGFGNARYAEDYELWLTMYEKGAIVRNVDDFLFRYRQFPQSLSQVNFKKNRADAKILGMNFIRKNKEKSLEAFQIVMNQNLSRKEQEILGIFGLRLTVIMKNPLFFIKALGKIDKKNLPSILIKALYTIVVD